MAITVARLAEIIEGTVEGDPSLEITGISSLADARAGDITFLANPRYTHLVETTAASAVVVGRKAPAVPGRTLIRCKNPDAAFALAAGHILPATPRQPVGIHPSAVIDPSARVAEDASVGANVVIEAGAEIASGVTLRPGVFIGRAVRIGERSFIYPHVTIREESVLGANVIIHAGAVIAADGFGYTIVDGRRIKIPQLGRVVIEDDVEIGANVTIDRARFGETRIGRGVKIDNLVQIAHNVRIGEGTVIVALCAIAGSTTLGRNCMLGGQVAIDGHLTIGDNVMIAAKSGVTKDIASNSVISGFPARNHKDDLRLSAELRKLVGASRRLERLEQLLADPVREDHRG